MTYFLYFVPFLLRLDFDKRVCVNVIFDSLVLISVFEQEGDYDPEFFHSMATTTIKFLLLGQCIMFLKQRFQKVQLLVRAHSTKNYIRNLCRNRRWVTCCSKVSWMDNGFSTTWTRNIILSIILFYGMLLNHTGFFYKIFLFTNDIHFYPSWKFLLKICLFGLHAKCNKHMTNAWTT